MFLEPRVAALAPLFGFALPLAVFGGLALVFGLDGSGGGHGGTDWSALVYVGLALLIYVLGILARHLDDVAAAFVFGCLYGLSGLVAVVVLAWMLDERFRGDAVEHLLKALVFFVAHGLLAIGSWGLGRGWRRLRGDPVVARSARPASGPPSVVGSLVRGLVLALVALGVDLLVLYAGVEADLPEAAMSVLVVGSSASVLVAGVFVFRLRAVPAASLGAGFALGTTLVLLVWWGVEGGFRFDPLPLWLLGLASMVPVPVGYAVGRLRGGRGALA